MPTPASEPLDTVLDLARDARDVVVLTGAGMSVESGIPTFRDAQTGLWERHDPEELATIDAWERDPDFVWAWYRWRAKLIRDVQPNVGHRALADWADAERANLWIVTQNIDDLHERAGSSVLAHLHGSIFALRCSECDTPFDEADDAALALTSEPSSGWPRRVARCVAQRCAPAWCGSAKNCRTSRSRTPRPRSSTPISSSASARLGSCSPRPGCRTGR